MQPDIQEFEARLGYRFVNAALLTRALTHRSLAGENPSDADNERLEFLGDSLLGFAVSEALVAAQPCAREGVLSRLKSHLVSSTHLHKCALEIGLGEYVRLGRGEERSGGRERKGLLADALEAVIAAIYLDGGIEPARNFIVSTVLKSLDSADELTGMERLNHKSVLQERAQALGLPTPRYITVGSSGPEHAKQFLIEARIGDEYAARASGGSKKTASQNAAEALLEKLA